MQLAYHWLSWTNEDTNFRETIDPILPEWVGSRVSISSRPIILVDWIASCVAFISIFFALLKKNWGYLRVLHEFLSQHVERLTS